MREQQRQHQTKQGQQLVQAAVGLAPPCSNAALPKAMQDQHQRRTKKKRQDPEHQQQQQQQQEQQPPVPAAPAPVPPPPQLPCAPQYRGVMRPKGKLQWLARVSHNGTTAIVGRHYTAEEAARAHDRAAVRLKPHRGLQLNFPLESYLDPQSGGLLPEERMDTLLRREWPLWSGPACCKPSPQPAPRKKKLPKPAADNQGCASGTTGCGPSQQPRALTKAFDCSIDGTSASLLRLPAQKNRPSSTEDTSPPPEEQPPGGGLPLQECSHPEAGPTPSSEYRGISWMENRKLWKVQVKLKASATHKRRDVYVGAYQLAEDAARAYDKAALRLKPRSQAQLNFKLEDYVDARGELLPEPRLDAILKGDWSNSALEGVTKSGKRKRSSTYRGARLNDREVRWLASMTHQGKAFHLGRYDTEVEAARAWDQVALRLKPRGKARLNFPPSDYLDERGELKPLGPALETLFSGILAKLSFPAPAP